MVSGNLPSQLEILSTGQNYHEQHPRLCIYTLHITAAVIMLLCLCEALACEADIACFSGAHPSPQWVVSSETVLLLLLKSWVKLAQGWSNTRCPTEYMDQPAMSGASPQVSEEELWLLI